MFASQAQLVFSVITGLTGPLVTVLMLPAIPSRPLNLINVIRSVILVLLYPLAVIGMTLLYYQFHPSEDREHEVTPNPAPQMPLVDPATT